MNAEKLDVGLILGRARFVHLDDAELDDLLNGRLDDLTQARVDAHLKLCLLCESRVAQARRADMSIQSSGWALAAKGKTRKRLRAQSDDGKWRWSWEVRRDLTMSVTVSVSDLDLNNRTIDVSGGRFSRTIELGPLTADRVGADLVLDARDRRLLGDNALTIALVPQTPPAPKSPSARRRRD